MLATFQASTKLCHCGSVGKEIPTGMVPCGASAADSMLSNGKIAKRHANSSRMVFGAVSRILVSIATSP